MKTLLLLRHAKSRHDNPHLTDHDRPLAPLGERDAPRMGQLLLDDDITPEYIISSTAERARQTAALVAVACEYEGELHFTRLLYLAEPEQYMAVARETDNRYDLLMLVGHNPGINDLMTQLTGERRKMPTAALAIIDLPIKRWQELTLRTPGILAEFWRPRDLRS